MMSSTNCHGLRYCGPGGPRERLGDRSTAARRGIHLMTTGIGRPDRFVRGVVNHQVAIVLLDQRLAEQSGGVALPQNLAARVVFNQVTVSLEYQPLWSRPRGTCRPQDRATLANDDISIAL